MLRGHEVEDISAGAIAETILARVGHRPCYLTFDIDCLDPDYAPGTGTGALDIRGGDVGEVSPPYDPAGITAIAGATVAMYLLALRGETVAGTRWEVD